MPNMNTTGSNNALNSVVLPDNLPWLFFIFVFIVAIAILIFHFYRQSKFFRKLVDRYVAIVSEHIGYGVKSALVLIAGWWLYGFSTNEGNSQSIFVLLTMAGVLVVGALGLAVLGWITKPAWNWFDAYIEKRVK